MFGTTQEIDLVFATEDLSSGWLEIEFASTRSKILAVTLRPEGDGESTARAVGGSGRAWRIGPLVVAADEGNVVVRVRYRGDPPVVRVFGFRDDAGQSSGAAAGGKRGRDAGGRDKRAKKRGAAAREPLRPSGVEVDASRGLDRIEALAIRKRLLDDHPGPDAELVRQHRYFLALEHEAPPSASGSSDAWSTLASQLSARAVQRARAAWAGVDLEQRSIPFAEGVDFAHCLGASRHLHAILEKSFGIEQEGEPERVIDFTAVRDAFRNFVLGRLRVDRVVDVESIGKRSPLRKMLADGVFESHGVPNGISYVLFAESALLFHEVERHVRSTRSACGVAPSRQREEDWRAVFEIVAGTVDRFTTLYWSGRGRTRDDYSFAHLSPAAAQFAAIGWPSADHPELAYPHCMSTQRYGDLLAHALLDEVSVGDGAPWLRDLGGVERQRAAGRLWHRVQLGDLAGQGLGTRSVPRVVVSESAREAERVQFHEREQA